MDGKKIKNWAIRFKVTYKFFILLREEKLYERKNNMKDLIIENEITDYQINEKGEIYSKKTNKILTGTIYNTGYRMVRLTTSKGKKGYAVHRLVAITFLPNPNNLPVVNHKDGNKLNNNVENLEWVTQSYNRKHASLNNLTKEAVGKRQKEDIVEDNIFWKRYKNTDYLVSKDGQVFNTKTKILLKQTPNNSGYIRYTLRINNQNKSKQAHILVIETWTNEDLQGKVINHKDGNKINNNLSNLEVVTKSENAIHSCYVLNKNVKSVIKITETEEIIYPSIIEAARQNNVTDGAIRYALVNNSKCCQAYWKYK